MLWYRRVLLAMLGCLCAVPLGLGPGATWLRERESLAEARPDSGHIIETRDGVLFYQQHGANGPIVVLAHGSGAWSQFWESAFIPLVDAGYRVVAFDMPPTGYSGPAESRDYGRVAQANRIADLIEHLGERPYLVAHSFGAGPMVEAAFRDPDAIRGLVLVSGAVGLEQHHDPGELPRLMESDWVRQTAVSMTATNPILTRVLLEHMVYRTEAVTDRHVAILQAPLTVRGMTASVSDWLPSLLVSPTDALSTRPESYRASQIPTYLIWGDRDTITPLSQGRALHDLLPRSEMTVLTDVGHIPHVEDPEQLNHLLIRALEGLQAGDEK